MGPAAKLDGQLLPGTLDVPLLNALTCGEAMHGDAVAPFIHQASSGILELEEGALYPALHRLKVRGLMRSAWRLSENNRRAKYYQLTALGRRALTREAENWRLAAGAVSQVLE